MNSSLHVCEDIQCLQQDLHDHVFLLRDYLLTKTSLTPPQFTKVPVQSHERERPCTYMLGVSILPLFLRLSDFGTVLKVWHILKKDRQYIGHEKRA